MSRMKPDELYAKLNQKNRTTRRTTHTQQQPKMHLPITNSSQYDKIKINTQSAENIISSTRKIKEDEIQQWIDQEHPGPIEVLKRISEVSLTHHSILTKIISELDDIISNPRPPSEMYRHKKSNSYKIDISGVSNSTQENQIFKPIDENRNNIETYINFDPYNDSYSFTNPRKMKSILADLLLDSHDYQNSVSDKKERIKQLREELEIQTKQRDELKSEFDCLQRLMDTEKFGQFAALKADEKEFKLYQSLKADDRTALKRQSEYSQLWGESRQLREDINKIKNQIAENRNFQTNVVHEMAIKKLKDTKKGEDKMSNEEN